MHVRPVHIGMVTLALALPIAASAAMAQQQLWFVPWKVLDRGAQPTPAPLVLFWLPASADDLKRSELVLSERLTAYASRCVAMNVIRAEDQDAVARLGDGRKLPLAVLVDGDRKLGRVESENGALRLAAVESLVRGAFDTREAAADAALIEAKKLAAAGDMDQAISLYRGVAAQRCMFPRQAKTAARALRRLGAAE